MRYFVVGCLALILVASAQSGCNVHDFYGLAYRWHNPTERHAQLLGWLHLYGDKCNKEQLVHIWNNLPAWAGTADSAEIRQKIISLHELLVVKESK